MNNTQKDIIDAVDIINEELYEKAVNKQKFPYLLITFAPFVESVDLILNADFCSEINIYNSEDNDREFFEKTNEYETFYKYFKRNIKEVKKEISSIKI